MNNISKSDVVPILSLPSEEYRYKQLQNLFKEKFASSPTFFVRVPGRVNIIGEHIDYCGYPVLPMALEQDILIAVRPIENQEVIIHNVNSEYSKFFISITTFEDILINPDINGKPYWYNYVLCGIKGALEYLNNKMSKGLQILIDGNIPPASGLSSSSALVSAACLSFLYAQNSNLNKIEIASLCAKSERYIGTQGGGMDQAIAFLAEKNCAQYITWQPLKATAVSLPEDAAFVIAHSLAEANKAATNDFNRRVIECRLSAKVLAYLLELTNDSNIITLSEVQKLLNKDLKDMAKLVLEYLPKDIYTKEEICHILNINVSKLNDSYLTSNTRHLSEFKLKQRALHVYEEAMRVEEFRKICTSSKVNRSSQGSNGDKSSENGDYLSNDALNTLGELMTKSHNSLKLLYECSHDNLDKLVEISNEMNVPSRLTGAGWGGCIVALCPKNKIDNYIETLKEKFYGEYCKLNINEVKQYIFTTTPNHGAVIYVTAN